MSKPVETQSRLHIGKDGFSLPLDIVTSTVTVLARKGSGKTYLASVLAEELLDCRQQIAVIDPTGAWWGLRSSASGDGPGYPVVVFGGDHADIPLEPHAGRMLAQVVVNSGISAIFDVSQMLTDEQVRFTSDFASELLRLNRTALHLFIDEADTFAPQTTLGKLQQVCLGTVSRLVKQGRLRGVGLTLITQRPQDINKRVLSQVDLLVVLRMGLPHDIAAATDWIKSEVSAEFARTVADALPSLAIGTAFMSSASLGIGERVEIRERRTYNSGATPKAGQRKAEPRVLAAVDIERLGREIAASARAAQESSPEYLRKRIAELEAAASGGEAKQSQGGIAGLEAEIARLRPEAERAAALARDLRAAEVALREMRAAVGALAEKFGAPPTAAPADKLVADSIPVAPPRIPEPPPTASPAQAAVSLNGRPKGEQKILDALANLEAVGVGQPSKRLLAAFAGYSNPASGGFAAPVASLGRLDLIRSGDGSATLTDAGRAVANKPTRPATTRELHERIFGVLGKGERKLLGLLIEAHPESISRVELASRADYTNAASGGFAAPLARLVELGFAEVVRPGVVRGSDMLFMKTGRNR